MTGLQNYAADYRVATRSPEEWAGIISSTFKGLAFRTPDRPAFSAMLAIRELATIPVAMVQSSAATIVHAGCDDELDADGRFIVKTQLSGESEIRTRHKSVRLRRGDFIVCDRAKPFCLSFDEETEIVSIPIPANFLERFLPSPEAIAFVAGDRSFAAHSVASDYLFSLLRAQGLPASQRQAAQLRDTYFELLALALENTARALAPVSTVRSTHFARSKALIDSRLEDEELNIDEIAHALGISKRYLHSIFSDSGQSVSGYILNARLGRAARMLRSKAHHGKTVSEIAYTCGFKSVAHFSRTFKVCYGETPNEYRQHTFG